MPTASISKIPLRQDHVFNLVAFLLQAVSFPILQVGEVLKVALMGRYYRDS
jgi:hypothetical protein